MLKRLSSGLITPKEVVYEYHIYFYPSNIKRYDKKIGIKRCKTEEEAKKLIQELNEKKATMPFDIYDKELNMRIYVIGINGEYKIKRKKFNPRINESF